MKLKNKKTGEIIIAKFFVDYHSDDGADIGFYEKDSEGLTIHVYDNLAELNEDWEDYEDELFYIVSAEHKDGYICALKEDDKELCDVAKELGIGFETEKEAEKAVEKLKAWERLQKKFNFHITGWDVLDTQVIITTDCDFDYVKDRQDDGLWADLDLVFNGNLLSGGEE